MALPDPPVTAVREAVARALEEDLGALGDVTSALLPDGAEAEAHFVVREQGVLAGLACAVETLRQVDPTISGDWRAVDGDRLAADQVLGAVSGPLAGILTAERTALNFLGHLSGIATRTSRFVTAAGPDLGVWDTRKTTPGLRALEKAAVRAGGGANHRGGLSDWVLLKDNHLAVLGIDEAVRLARQRWPARTVHVECDRPEQAAAALDAGADALLLDNMGPDEVRHCVGLADEHAAARQTGRCLIEISGGISLETIGAFVGTGADRVSSGSITNSSPVLDIGLDIAPR